MEDLPEKVNRLKISFTAEQDLIQIGEELCPFREVFNPHLVADPVNINPVLVSKVLSRVYLLGKKLNLGFLQSSCLRFSNRIFINNCWLSVEDSNIIDELLSEANGC